MGERKTVLIVEDHEDFREVLSETLRMEGWATVLAKNAEEAIQAAKRAVVHVVLTDVILPSISGIALEQAFYGDPALADIPFVFMTGFAPHLDEVGRHRALMKPFQMTDLCALLRTYANHSRSRT